MNFQFRTSCQWKHAACALLCVCVGGFTQHGVYDIHLHCHMRQKFSLMSNIPLCECLTFIYLTSWNWHLASFQFRAIINSIVTDITDIIPKHTFSYAYDKHVCWTCTSKAKCWVIGSYALECSIGKESHTACVQADGNRLSTLLVKGSV